MFIISKFDSILYEKYEQMYVIINAVCNHDK